MKIVGIGGQPACGKTFLMRSVMANISSAQGLPFTPKAFGTALYEQCGRVYVMGRYEGVENYAGTDRMSMNCYRSVKFLWRKIAADVPNAVVLFEGNRLFKADMLAFAESIGADCTWAVLDVPADVLHQRHRQRKDTQTEQILKARATELERLQTNNPSIELWPNALPNHLNANLARLLRLSEVK